MQDRTAKRKKLARSEKRWGYFPGNLRHDGPCNTIGVDIFTTCEEKHGVCDCRSGEDSSGSFFALPLPQKIEIYPAHRRNFMYDAGQEIWPGTPKHGDSSQ